MAHDPPAAAAASAQEPPAQAASLAARASNLALGALKLSWQTYVGVAAVAAGYGAMRYAGNATPGTADGPPATGPLVDLPTVHQAKADVLQRHAPYIPADSACHAIEPVVTPYLPPDHRGWLERSTQGKDRGQPISLRVREGLPRDVGAHTARHEFLHCFTHPAFTNLLAGSPHQRTINEALTEHYADQFPDHPATTHWVDQPVVNGKTGVEAAAELEQKVGKKTLQRAYFKGEPRAMAKVSAAIVDIWPKDTTWMAWAGIFRLRDQPAQQLALAECFVGATLLYTDRLPKDEGVVEPGHLLPVRRFSDISSSQAAAMRRQAEAAKARHGSTFDQAFCNFEGKRQGQAMAEIAQELAANWRRVLV